MISAAHILATFILALGCLTALTSAMGVNRLPDFYSRMHAAGKTDTLAQLLIITALLIEAGTNLNLAAGLKLLLISGFLLITTPASTHAIAQAAYLEGLTPWSPPEPEAPPAPDEDAPPPSAGEPEAETA